MRLQSELPEHLFMTSDGTLYDTRRDDWSRHPLRDGYRYHFRDIDTTSKLKATLRAGEYAWPGSYPLFFITSDGGFLHFDCVRNNLESVLWSIKNKCDDGWRVVACDINHESELWCDECGERIESAYGEGD